MHKRAGSAASQRNEGEALTPTRHNRSDSFDGGPRHVFHCQAVGFLFSVTEEITSQIIRRKPGKIRETFRGYGIPQRRGWKQARRELRLPGHNHVHEIDHGVCPLRVRRACDAYAPPCEVEGELLAALQRIKPTRGRPPDKCAFFHTVRCPACGHDFSQRGYGHRSVAAVDLEVHLRLGRRRDPGALTRHRPYARPPALNRALRRAPVAVCIVPVVACFVLLFPAVSADSGAYGGAIALRALLALRLVAPIPDAGESRALGAELPAREVALPGACDIARVAAVALIDGNSVAAPTLPSILDRAGSGTTVVVLHVPVVACFRAVANSVAAERDATCPIADNFVEVMGKTPTRPAGK